MQLTEACIFDILNKLADIGAPLNFRMSASNLSFCINNYAILNYGFYESCSASTEGAIKIVEAFNNKN